MSPTPPVKEECWRLSLHTPCSRYEEPVYNFTSTLYSAIYKVTIYFNAFLHSAIVFYKIPRYIITLHELLAHTPHEHVERKSLEFAKSKLEELSRCVSGCHNQQLLSVLSNK